MYNCGASTPVSDFRVHGGQVHDHRRHQETAVWADAVTQFVAWAVVTALYIWPELQARSRIEALRPLLALHGFRFIGLSFLVPGVVSADLPMAFARNAAYGDLVAAILALLALSALRSKLGIALAWIFNIWGSLDLLNAFYVANATGLLAGQLGAAYFIPTAIVPLLLITHGLVFRILLQHDRPTA
jgi:hypothetical protein